MRRIVVIVSGLLLASVLVSLAALSAGAQTAPSQDTLGPSQGTLTDGKAGPNEPSLVDDTPPTEAELAELDAALKRKGRVTGGDVVRWAKRYIGTRYRYSTCTQARMSCTCLTKRTWARFGHKLPMSEGGQWRYRPGNRVAKSQLRLGDIVYFKEGGRRGGITHVGIYSGRGKLVHASNYFGRVVESKMKYLRGYSGAKRLRPR